MTKKILFIFLSFVLCVNSYAQMTAADSAAMEEAAEGKKPVRDPWACNALIDNQTAYMAPKGTTEFMIHHRFSDFSQKMDNLYGIYGTSNIRLGVTKVICNHVMLGFGTEKENKQQEFTAKVLLLNQNRKGSIPVSVVFFGNAAISTKKKELWGDGFKFIDRMSYFGQLMISRKFTDKLSFQVSGSYAHFNKVESNKIKTVKTLNDTTTQTTIEYKNKYANDVFGVACGGRYKFYNEMSVVAEYSHPILALDLSKLENSEILSPKPNLALGLEIATNTHAFQIFVASARSIIAQNNLVKNQIDFTDPKQMLIGFNITVRLN